MSKVPAVANVLAIFILTIGASAAWFALQEDNFQDRVALYSYARTLFAIARALDGNADLGKTLERSELCNYFEEWEDCFLEIPDQGSGTSTAYSPKTGKSKKYTDVPVQGFRVVEDFAVSDLETSHFSFGYLAVPLSTASGREFLEKVIGEDHITKAIKAFYIEFPDKGRGWPAVITKMGPGANDWVITLTSWGPLWFIKGEHGYGISAPVKVEWETELPSEIRHNIDSFRNGYYRVTYHAFETQIIRDADALSGSRLGVTTVEEAERLVLSPPSNTIKISGLPESKDFISVAVPFVLVYAAFALRSAVRQRATTSSEPVERTGFQPWMLLNAETIPEIMLALLACAAMSLAVVFVIWMTLITDAQLNGRYLRFQHYVSGDPYYLVRRTWVSDLHDSARETGTAYLDRFPWFGVVRLLACALGLWALGRSIQDLLRSYRSINRIFRRATLPWRMTFREWIESLGPTFTFIKLNLLGPLGRFSRRAFRWSILAASNRWLWRGVCFVYVTAWLFHFSILLLAQPNSPFDRIASILHVDLALHLDVLGYFVQLIAAAAFFGLAFPNRFITPAWWTLLFLLYLAYTSFYILSFSDKLTGMAVALMFLGLNPTIVDIQFYSELAWSILGGVAILLNAKSPGQRSPDEFSRPARSR